MVSSRNASKPISTRDKLTIAGILAFVAVIVVLMRMDTAAWVFKYEDHFIEITDTAQTPQLDFTIKQIGKDAVSVNLDMQNISLVEFCSGEDQGLAKGHAHIFVDGKKQGSFYITEHILQNVSSGIHTITVSINQPPSHRVLSWKGVPISVTKTITVY